VNHLAIVLKNWVPNGQAGVPEEATEATEATVSKYTADCHVTSKKEDFFLNTSKRVHW
jgi:hypothetical protein